MKRGIAGQLVLLVRDSTAADRMAEICCTAARCACTLNCSAAIAVTSRQRSIPRCTLHVFLPCFGPPYRWGQHALNGKTSKAACSADEDPPNPRGHERFAEVYTEGMCTDG